MPSERRYLLIGIPKQVQRALIPHANQLGIRLAFVFIAHERGRLKLLPTPKETASYVNMFLDGIDDPFETDIRVMVFDYVPLPADASAEVEVLEELGYRVSRFKQGADDWPELRGQRKFPEPFIQNLIWRLKDELGTTPASSISERLAQAIEDRPGIYATANALNTCDDVPEYRHNFLLESLEALHQLVVKQGSVGSFQTHFSGYGLALAQSGQISSTLRLVINGGDPRSDRTEVHLKAGDATSTAAATRIYFHTNNVQGHYLVVITHAGAHPDRNINSMLEIELREQD
jgi:hypothetical protein